MKALVLLHRWLGVGFCLLFAMWFASGIVMHFVPFPSLAETERFAGLSPIDASQLRHGPDEAVAAELVKDGVPEAAIAIPRRTRRMPRTVGMKPGPMCMSVPTR